MSDTAPSEAAIQRQIVEALLYDGWLVMRLNAGGMDVDGERYVTFVKWQAVGWVERDSGHADLLAAKDGRVLFVECKAPRGRQRKSQVRFMEACEHTGNAYVLARDLDDVKPYLTRMEVQ